MKAIIRCTAKWIITAALFGGVNGAFAKDILTSTPSTYLIASELMKGTKVTTQYLPPKRYGIERLPNWFESKGRQKVAQAGESATVAVTISSVWEADPTFIYARQGNIRLVEIDAAQALTPRAQGVAALSLSDGTISKYSWLNPTNLIRMASIVADDLKKLWPEHKLTIEANLQRLMLDVRELINLQQEAIFENDIDSVVLLSETLEDFVSGNQLFVVERLYDAELEWSQQQKQHLKSLFSDDETLWLVTSRKPSKSLLELVPEQRILVVDPVDRWGAKGVKADNPFERWQITF